MADLACVSDDGIGVTAKVVGTGRPLILLAGGIDYQGRGWDKAVPLLAARHQVVRFVRRFYRPELGDPFRWTMGDEASDVAAIAAKMGGTVDLIGHSSGGVLALECLLRDPTRYGSAVLFEAPIVDDRPLGGDALVRARASLEAGRRARAMTIFFREVVGLPTWLARLSAAALAVVPEYRARIPGQVADLAAIDTLGDRRATYRTIINPILGITSSDSPAHLAERMHALLEALPNAQSWRVKGGHAAQQQAPHEFTERVLTFLAPPPDPDRHPAHEG